MRLLVFNLATDVDDPILGFTTHWIRALARRVEAVQVITMRAGRLDLPNNVRVDSVGKPMNAQQATLENYQDLIWALIDTKEFLFNH